MSSWDLDWDVNWWWVLETWIEMWTGDEFLRPGLRCELVMSSWDLDWDVNWWLVLETWIGMWTGDEFLRLGLRCELLMSFIITHHSLTQNIWYIWKMWQNIFAFGIRSIKSGGGREGGRVMGAEAWGGAIGASFLWKGSDMPSFLSYPTKDLVGWGLAPCVWGSECVIISTSCCAEWGQRKGVVSLGWSTENGTRIRSDYKETSILDRLSLDRWLQESPSPVLNL